MDGIKHAEGQVPVPPYAPPQAGRAEGITKIKNIAIPLIALSAVLLAFAIGGGITTALFRNHFASVAILAFAF